MARKPVDAAAPQPIANRGDVVYLRSGSPKMTVIGVEGDDCECVWITYGSNQMQREKFPRIALRVIEIYVPPLNDTPPLDPRLIPWGSK